MAPKPRTRRQLLRDAGAAAGVAAPALLGMPALASAASAVPVTLTVDATAPGRTIPDDFAGIGFERGALTPGNAGVDGYLFDPANASLIGIFRRFGIRHLRVGGGTVDRPEAFGIKAFDLGGHGQVKPVAPSPAAEVELTAYAVGDGAGLSVTVINKTTGGSSVDAAVTVVAPGFVPRQAELVALSSGRPGDATPLTATLVGPTPLRPDATGKVSLTVPATTAAVVTMRG